MYICGELIKNCTSVFTRAVFFLPEGVLRHLKVLSHFLNV